MVTSGKGRLLIKQFEGLMLRAYKCSANRWTIGYGHTKNVSPDMRISRDQAERYFDEDIKAFEAGVRRLVKVSLLQHQFDALVSFSFNVGLDEDTDSKAEGLGDSTLLRLVNLGDFRGAAAEFEKWSRGGAGLPERRRKERKLFEGK